MAVVAALVVVVDGAEAASELGAGVVAASVLACEVPPSEDLSAMGGVAAALPPSRKSVTYQPDPFSWKPAAVTCFSSVSCPHAGQVVSGASEIFRRMSLTIPQDKHL